MKRCFAVSLLCLALALALPVLAVGFAPESALPSAAPAPSPTPSAAPAASPTPAASSSEAPAPLSADEATVFSVLTPEGETKLTTMAAYLPGVLAGEMPAAFEPEALRAQAVAARTYILCRLGETSAAHPDAAVCADPGCCQAWLSEAQLRQRWGDDYAGYAQKLAAAVTDTDGVYLSWEDEPILACFHSSSAGSTESSAAVWSGALPYLVSVSSPETAADVPNYISTLSLSAEEFRSKLQSAYPGATLEGEPADWLGPCRLDESGRVESLAIGGLELSGTELRSLFSLRSTAFTLTTDGESFLFTVTGYGHGVGMSQYGANVMAAGGAGWADILAHYYPGTSLRRWGE